MIAQLLLVGAPGAAPLAALLVLSLPLILNICLPVSAPQNTQLRHKASFCFFFPSLSFLNRIQYSINKEHYVYYLISPAGWKLQGCGSEVGSAGWFGDAGEDRKLHFEAVMRKEAPEAADWQAAGHTCQRKKSW